MMFERSAAVWPKHHSDNVESASVVYSVMTNDDSLLPTSRENSQKYNNTGGNRSFRKMLFPRLRNRNEQLSFPNEATREGIRISKLRNEKLLAWHNPF